MKNRERLKFYFSRLAAGRSKLFSQSEVFCMAPWIQLHAQTNGKVAPCCMSSVHGGNELGDLRENPSLQDAWNSANTRQLRLNMLQGKKSSICTHCYDYEKMGKFSERMQYNQDFKHYYSRVMSTSKDGSLKELSVPLVDIRFSNKCNYKCRICDSSYSTLLYDEEQKIGKPPGLPTTKEMKVAEDETKFWESYQRLLPDVKRLHFAGGEPLIMEEHYKALEYLISIGRTDINLTYNTNFSTLRFKKYSVTDLWNKFKKVDVWASLDGMGEIGDYQRKGQRWKKIEENISALQRECPQVFFGVNATVSIFNVLHIPEFYQYMVENKFVQPDRMNLYLLFDPQYFSITNLTPAIKKRAVKQFEDFASGYLKTLQDTEKIKNHINAVVTYMLSEDLLKQNDFQHWVNTTDAVRGEKFISIFPDLAELMQAQLMTGIEKV